MRLRDAAGNVSVLFALMVIPIMGLIGLAIDYGRANDLKAHLSQAADAAVLAAAGQVETSLAASATDADAVAAGKAAADAMFASYVAAVAGQLSVQPHFSADITLSNTDFTVTASFDQAKSAGVMSSLFGVSGFPLAYSASAVHKRVKYVNISLVSDISQSMGLAATDADATRLKSLTGCAFGCHVPQTGQTISNEAIAAAAGVKLRIDVLRESAKSMIDTAIDTGSNRTTITLYALQAGSPVPGASALTTLSAASSDAAALRTAANGIDLGNNVSLGYGDTDLKTALTSLASTVPASGTGSSTSQRMQYLFLISDGVQDTFSTACTSTHCTQALDPAWCAGLKAKGITVGVIYTTYLPITGDTDYNNLVAPFQSTIATRMQSCASTGWYYEASDTVSLKTAMKALYDQTAGSTYLSR